MSADSPTFARALHDATSALEAVSGDESRLEAELLLAHAAGVDRAHVIALLHETLRRDTSSAFDAMFARRLAREPLAYIVGRREFYGIEIETTPAALIPRPETEMVVAFALDEIAARGDACRVADVGTGTGAIAIAIAVNATVRLTATDSSPDALDLARRNAESAGVAGRIDFRHGDMLDGAGVFDVIVANLPYVSEGDWRELAPEIRDHEPRAALVGGRLGTEVIERFLEIAPAHLAPGGALAAEIGDTQAEHLIDVAARCFPEARVCVKKDFAGLDRMLVVRRQGE